MKRALSLLVVLIAAVLTLPLHAQNPELWIVCEPDILETTERIAGDLNCDVNDYTIVFERALRGEDVRDLFRARLQNEGKFDGFLKGGSASLAYMTAMVLLNTNRITVGDEIITLLRNAEFEPSEKSPRCNGFTGLDGANRQNWRFGDTCFEEEIIDAAAYAWKAAFFRRIGDKDQSDRDRSDAIRLVKKAFSAADKRSICIYDKDPDGDGTFEPAEDLDSDSGPCNAGIDELAASLKNDDGRVVVLALNHGHESPAYGIGIIASLAHAFVGLKAAGRPVDKSSDFGAMEDEINSLMESLFEQGQRGSVNTGSLFSFQCYFGSNGTPPFTDDDMNPDNRNRPCQDRFARAEWFMHTQAELEATGYGPGFSFYYRPAMFSVLNFYRQYGFDTGGNGTGFQFDGGSFSLVENDFRSDRRAFFGPARALIYHEVPDQWTKALPKELCGRDATFLSPPRLVPPDFSVTVFVRDAVGSKYEWSITGGTITSPPDKASVTFTTGSSGEVRLTVKVTGLCGDFDTNTLVVPIGRGSLIFVDNTTAPAGERTAFRARLDAVQGGPIPDQELIFSVLNREIGRAVTDATGRAVVFAVINDLKPGVYRDAISVTWAGNGQILGSTWTAHLTVTCEEYTLTPPEPILSSDEQTITIIVGAPSECPWTPVSDSSWITVAANPDPDADPERPNDPPDGPGSFRLHVTRLDSGTRSGKVTVGTKTVPVTQSSACAFRFVEELAYVPWDGAGFTRMDISASPGCDWYVRSDSSWLSIEDTDGVRDGTMHGSGSGFVAFTVDRNLGPVRRNGRLNLHDGQTGAVANVAKVNQDKQPPATIPVVEEAPRGGSVSDGQNVTMRIVVSGSPLHYRWYTDGEIIRDGDDPSLANLTIAPGMAGYPPAGDSRTYRVEVSNFLDRVDRTVTWTNFGNTGPCRVPSLADSTFHTNVWPSDQNAPSSHSQITMRIFAEHGSGSPRTKPVEYQWYAGIAPGGSEISGATADELKVSPGSTAYYWVKATDPDCGSNHSRTAEIRTTDPPRPPRRRAVGFDFTGDNQSDIVWHNTVTGENQIWEMHGTAYHDTKPVATNTVRSNAEIQSVGDLDGDDRPDLIWRDPQSGYNEVWLMSFWNRRGSEIPLEARGGGSSWSIGAVADFDGDEQHDIVWHNNVTRENEIWFQQGTAHEGSWALPSNPAGTWGLHGTADFDRDGDPDLFFHDRSTGNSSVWIMSDAERLSAQSKLSSHTARGRFSVTTHAVPKMSNPNFLPMQIADMNGDGWPDIVWRNVVSGENTVWPMIGTSPFGDPIPLDPRDPTWTIGGGGGTGTGGEGSDTRIATTLQVTALPAAFNGAAAVTATLTANGAPVAGRHVVFLSSGTQIGSLITDSSGTAVTGASVSGLAAGTYPNAISVRFAGDTQYAPSEGKADLIVQQALPVITWGDPAPVTYGTILGAAQLNATANVPGTFSYSPPAGTIPDGGFNALTATFTPSDSSLVTVTKTVVLFVNPAPVTITWAAPSAIAYGTALSGAQLNASTGLSGTFTYAPSAGTLLGVGTHTLQVTFTPGAPANYLPATASRTIEVIQGTQTISWQTPAPIVYGMPLTAAQLNATVTASAAPPAGALAYDPPAGTILTAGTHTLTAFAAPTQFYAGASKSVMLIVQKAPPVITWAAPAPIVYGTPLSVAQLNATANVPGTFIYSPTAGTVLNAGTQTLSVQFTPSDANNYESASASVSLVVQKAKPVLTWPAPASIVYGTPLSSTQLNATANVPGTFAYSPAAGTILNAGAGQTLSAQFTPSDASNYEPASATTTITVTRATQTLSWSTPAPIVYGTPLSATQLDATVSVVGPSPAGALTYVPPAGTILQAGNGQGLTVNAAETANYQPATLSVTIDVLKQKPVLAWSQPAPIVYRTVLSAAQLNATSNIAGTFVYMPLAGTVLEAGMQPLSAHFTPSDTRNYEEGDINVTLEVQQATPLITWPQPAGIVYGTPLSATQLNATADVPGTFTYDPAAGTILDAGLAQTLSVHFEPADARNFKNADGSVTIDVAKAKQTLSWASPAPIVYGVPLSATQLNAQVSVVGPAAAGALVYTPSAGTVLDAGSHTLTVVAQEMPNYDSATLSVSIHVGRAPLSLTVDPKSKLYGAPLPALTGTLIGVVNNDPITPSYATTATQQSGTGTYPITATLVDPAHRLVNYDVTITTSALAILPAPLQIAANAATKQYSDPLPQLAATFTGLVLGETPAVLSGTLVIETTATALSAPGTYPITIGGLSSPNYAIVYIPATMTVTAEDARVTITSPLLATASATAPARITLSATVKDISATADAAGDADSGDIRKATLAFVDRATNTILCTAPIGLASSSDLRVGVATCTFTANFPTGTSSLHVGARVGGYYVRDHSSDDVTMTIVAPTTDFVTGGGSTSGGAFNINVQYDKKGLKGAFTFKSAQYEITAATLDSLAIQRSAHGGTAFIVGTATLRDVATGAVLDTAAPLIVTATDDGEPSTGDALSVALLRKDGGFWFITGWDGTRAVAQPLVGGNIAVHLGK